jgi:hypothetical protein
MLLFQCDQGVLGRGLDLDHRQFNIVGVMPPRFTWNGATAFIPLVPGKDPDDSYPLYLRARKGVRAGILSAQMLALVRQFVLASEGVELPPETHLRPIELDQRNGGSLQKRLELLFAAVFMLLLIACANVSILLLGRATVRQHEFEIRNALGASRLRLAGQLLTEALLIALGGGVLGIALLSESGVVLSGLAVGIVLSVALGRLIRSFISMPAQSTWLLPASCLVMVTVSALASYLPARRAARIEPMQALRAE